MVHLLLGNKGVRLHNACLTYPLEGEGLTNQRICLPLDSGPQAAMMPRDSGGGRLKIDKTLSQLTAVCPPEPESLGVLHPL